ncbi:hypothetical protein ACFVXC_08860 [Streptomyces sp. NPDC058257]|uniref:hypothetical protein n=1 Tax=Streptomyces sp. NPDC058257 TaxID=3346409 RepID=UPI0036EEF999
MQEAVYGLLGAVGGAVVTAAAAYWGPLQAQKRSREQAEEERRLAQERAEQEGALVRREAAAAERRERQQAQVAVVARVRRSVGDWCQLLSAARYRYDGGIADDQRRRDEEERFRQVMAHARDAASASIYDALNEGLHIRSSEGSVPLGDGARAQRHEDGKRLILDALDDATFMIRQLIVLAPNDERRRQATARAAYSFRQLLEVRATLAQILMERVVDIMDVDVIDTSGGAGFSAGGSARPPGTP